MNRNGFTLTELLVAIVLLSIIMAITIPSLFLYKKETDKTLYYEYERMMVLYAEESEIAKEKIKLSELNGLENIKKDCQGYVKKKNNEYKAYISCNHKYQTKGYEKEE